MAQPTILNPNSDESAASADSTVYGHAGGSGRANQDLSTSVTIPAEANTVIVVGFVDGEDHAEPRVSGATISGIGSPIFTVDNFGFHDDSTQTLSVNMVAVSVTIYDVSSLPAKTGLTLNATFSTSTDKACLAAVLCTDGFVQNAFVQNQTGGTGVLDDKFLIPDAENSIVAGVYCIQTGGSASLTARESSTVLFKTTGSIPVTTGEASCAGLSQSNFTGSEYLKTFNLVGETSSGKPKSAAYFFINSQKDPYHGITGKLTSPIVK